MKAILWATMLVGAGWAMAEESMTVKDLEREGLAPQTLVYRRVEGRDLRLDVTMPPDHRADARKPAVLLIHGGGWGAPGPFRFAPHARYFAARGLVAVNVEYRLTNPTNSPIQAAVSDCQAAFRYAHGHAAELGIDATRIAVMGDSAGGHLAACVGLLPEVEPPAGESAPFPRPAALILCNPVVDLMSLEWAHGVPGIKALLSKPETDLEAWKVRAKAMSPIQFVKAGLPPMLLIHGTADTCVPVEQIDRFAKAVKDAGNACQYERIEGWPHAFVLIGYAKDEHSVKATRIIDRYLAGLGWLAGEPTIGPGQ